MTDQPWTAPGSGPAEPSRPGSAPPPPPGSPGPPPGTAPAVPPGYPPPPSGPYLRMDVRPGIVPLRPLGLGDIYGGVFTAVRGNPGATLGLAVVTTFAFLLPTTALGAVLSGQSGLDAFDDSAAASDTLPSGLGLGLLGTYLPSVGQSLSAILLAGFLAQVVGQAVLGRKVSMGATWRATRGRVPAMVGAVLVTIAALVGIVLLTLGIPIGLAVYADSAGVDSIGLIVLLVLVGVLLFLVATFVVYTRWAFATPAIVLERAGVLRSLRRSWQLVGGPLSGSFWRVLGIRLLTAIVVGFAGAVVTFPISIVLVLVATVVIGEDPSGSSFLVLQTIVSGIAGLIVGALTTPFSAGVDALLYVDARIRREGLDVRLIQATQGASEPPWPVVSA